MTKALTTATSRMRMTFGVQLSPPMDDSEVAIIAAVMHAMDSSTSPQRRT